MRVNIQLSIIEWTATLGSSGDIRGFSAKLEIIKGFWKNKMTGIDEVILYDNKAKNVGIPDSIGVVTARLFNEVSMQKNESKTVRLFLYKP